MEPLNTTNKRGEGYRLNKGKFWCDKCKFSVENTNKNAIRRHLTTQHSVEISPMTKREIKEMIKMRKLGRKENFQIAYHKDDKGKVDIEIKNNTQENYTTEINSDKEEAVKGIQKHKQRLEETAGAIKLNEATEANEGKKEYKTAKNSEE